MAKRFFVQSTEDWHKRLRVLAVLFDSTAEKFGARLLEEAIERKEAEAASRKLPKQPRR